MDLAKQLFDDAWDSIRFAQKKIDDARRSLREAGAPPDDPSLKLTEEALRKLSEATKAVVDLKFPKGEPIKVGRTCGYCNHSRFSNAFGLLICFRDNHRTPHEVSGPACEHFELTSDKLFAAFKTALGDSRRECPNFVPPPQEKRRARLYATDARVCKGYIEEGLKEIPSEDEENALGGYRFDLLRNTLFAASYEFLVEVSAKNFYQSLKKAGEIIAILYRTLNGDGENKGDKK